MPIVLDIEYSCAPCGIKDRKVSVPVRAESQDVIAWLESTVVPCIARDHHQQSPLCGATEITETKIPLDGRDAVGGPVIH